MLAIGTSNTVTKGDGNSRSVRSKSTKSERGASKHRISITVQHTSRLACVRDTKPWTCGGGQGEVVLT